ncbi:hypothetical protein VTI74DRAFT_7822 [Chaetomium olivicolor]
MRTVLGDGREDLAGPLLELLRYLIQHKVPSADYDLYGSTPLGTLVSEVYNPSSICVAASELILQSSVDIAPAHLLQAPRPLRVMPESNRVHMCRPIQFLGSSAQIAEAYGCGELSLAVLANDEARVEFLLRHRPSSLRERNLLGQTPLHLAVDKPSCLRLIARAADHEILNQTDNSQTSALEKAIVLSGTLCKYEMARRRCRRCTCAESTIILLKADCAVPLSVRLSDLLGEASHRCRLKYIRAMRDRRERLKQLALDCLTPTEAGRLGLSEDGVLDHFAAETITLLQRRGIRIPHALSHVITGGSRLESVYEALRNLGDAELFFRMGFHDVDCQGKHLASKIPRSRFLFNLQYLKWLTEHGLDVLSLPRELPSQPRGSIPAFWTFRCIGNELDELDPIYGLPDSLKAWIRGLSRMARASGVFDVTDNCRCVCSPRGCTPFTHLLKGAVDAEGYDFELDIHWSATVFSEYIELDGSGLQPEHHAAALRFFTYTALGIRHTCCSDYSHHLEEDYTPPGTMEDVQADHPYEIQLLEELLDEFESQITPILLNPEQGVAELVKFWKNTWADRLIDVRSSLEGSALTDEERRAAEDIGVVWDQPAPPATPTSNPYPEYIIEYWFHELEQIEA